MIGFLLIISILIRYNISSIYAKIKFVNCIENHSFLLKLLFINSSSSNLIEMDLIKMIQNDQFIKIIQIDRLTLNKFSQLIQLTDRILILGYCWITIAMYYLIL